MSNPSSSSFEKRKERRRQSKNRKSNQENQEDPVNSKSINSADKEFENDLDYLLTSTEKDANSLIKEQEYVMVESVDEIVISAEKDKEIGKLKPKKIEAKGFTVADITKDMEGLDFSTDDEGEGEGEGKESSVKVEKKKPKNKNLKEDKEVDTGSKNIQDKPKPRKPRNRNKRKDEKKPDQEQGGEENELLATTEIKPLEGKSNVNDKPESSKKRKPRNRSKNDDTEELKDDATTEKKQEIVKPTNRRPRNRKKKVEDVKSDEKAIIFKDEKEAETTTEQNSEITRAPETTETKSKSKRPRNRKKKTEKKPESTNEEKSEPQAEAVDNLSAQSEESKPAEKKKKSSTRKPKAAKDSENPNEAKETANEERQVTTQDLANAVDSNKQDKQDKSKKPRTRKPKAKKQEVSIEDNKVCEDNKINENNDRIDDAKESTEEEGEVEGVEEEVKPIFQQLKHHQIDENPFNIKLRSVKSSTKNTTNSILPELKPIKTIIGLSHQQILHGDLSDVKIKTLMNSSSASKYASSSIKFTTKYTDEIFNKFELKKIFITLCINIALHESIGYKKTIQLYPNILELFSQYDELNLETTRTQLTKSNKLIHQNNLDYSVLSYFGHILIWALDQQRRNKFSLFIEKFELNLTKKEIQSKIGGFHLWDKLFRELKGMNSKRWKHIIKFRNLFPYEEDQFMIILRFMNIDENI
ncbi:unnamed protein product [Candida verbasci]|uniref:Uncharacterized protein n=1 Tax=Candida verbasci TaxID=1227364 RepID=A0A9W4TU63_9ASCO|nr:unnamed protein product [Candida verbasci]